MEEVRWKRMMFKGCKVYAQVDESGHLLTRDSRVTIKYQLHQDQEYKAGADAVREINEDLLKKGTKGTNKRKAKPHNGKVPSPLPEDAKERGIIIYSDGACKGNPGPAGIGVVFLYKSHQKEISRFIGQATNNIAELSAIKIALKEVKDPTLPIYLHTDSAYCYGLLTKGWKARQNKELVEDIKKEMARFPKLSIIKVEGHAGIEKNERADQLAREAITKGSK
jgi:ribonuclease HI